MQGRTPINPDPPVPPTPVAPPLPANPAKVPALLIPTAAKPARKRPRLWPSVAVLFVVAAGALWYYQPWAPKIATVLTETMTPPPSAGFWPSMAASPPCTRSMSAPVLTGVVLTVAKDEGDTVAAGDVLVTLDASGQEAAVR